MSRTRRRMIAKGWTSTIYSHQADRKKVIKKLEGPRAQAHFDVERRAYERLRRLERPSSIVEYFGIDDELDYSIVLEYLPLGDLYVYLCDTETIADTTKWSWACDAAAALSYVHLCGILHCDIHAANFFLDADLNLKLADFGAASIDGERPLMLYRASHQLWLKDEDDVWQRDVSYASEIFALGCVFYSIENRNLMFVADGEEVDDDEIKRRLKAREYPEIAEGMVLGEVVEKCWSQHYQTMDELRMDLPNPQDP